MVIVGGVVLRMHPGQSWVRGVGVSIVLPFMAPVPAAGWPGKIAAGGVGGTVLVVQRSLHHPGS